MTLDESIELWQKEHEHEIVYACNMDTEVQEIVDRVNPWHTGIPKKENLEHEHCYAISHNNGHGFYLVGTLFKANHENGCFESEEVYDNIGNVDTLKFEFNDKSIRWQNIEPYRG